jgi:tRNA pseudouridine13 synthase
MSNTVRKREGDDIEIDRNTKHIKVFHERDLDLDEPTETLDNAKAIDSSSFPKSSLDDLLPPSKVLIPREESISRQRNAYRIDECGVGISEYISHNIPKIDGIIKQRCARWPT